MPKLGPSLQLALATWRIELDHARSGLYAELNPAEVEGRRVSVVVTYQGDVSALCEAGLKTGFDDGRMISGQIAFQDIERLEAAQGVIEIVIEPRVKVLLDGSVKEMRVPWNVPPATPWPGTGGAGVIVAVIDTGIDIFHNSFRKADGTTRILELWDQSATAGGVLPPAGFSADDRPGLRCQCHQGRVLQPALPSHSIDSEWPRHPCRRHRCGQRTAGRPLQLPRPLRRRRARSGPGDCQGDRLPPGAHSTFPRR